MRFSAKWASRAFTFAIVCASVGCPRLRNKAYTPDRHQRPTGRERPRLLRPRVRIFEIDAAHQTLQLSAILDWFGGDFGRTQAEQLRTLAPYFPSVRTAQFVRSGNVTIKYLDYDWSLNDQARLASTQVPLRPSMKLWQYQRA